MNLRKKALVPAVAMVVASVIALSGVTYAWFTTGNTATVGSLDVNVQTANGIQISLDAQSWKSMLTSSDIVNAALNNTNVDIQYPYGTAAAPVEIAPVSTAGVVSNGRLEMFCGEYNKDGSLKSVREEEQTRISGGNFIAFDLYFKTSSDQVLTLDLGDVKSYVKCIDLSKKTGDDAAPGSDAGTETAVRVAFLPLGSAATPEAARGLKGTCTPLIWEPNSTSHANSDAASGKLAYKGFKAEFDGVSEDTLAPEKADDDNSAKVTTFDGKQDIVELKKGINKIRIYIWLEGQDVDCINNISNGDFTTNLYFSVPEVGSETSEGE